MLDIPWQMWWLAVMILVFVCCISFLIGYFVRIGWETAGDSVASKRRIEELVREAYFHDAKDGGG